MSYQGIGDVFMMGRRAELICNGFTILEHFADPVRFPKRLAETAGLPANYQRMFLHSLMVWVHSKFPGEEKLREPANRTRWSPIFNQAFPEVYQRERNEGIARYS